MPRVTGGRYGLSSKEFSPGMVAGVLEHLKLDAPREASRSASMTTCRVRASLTTLALISNRPKRSGPCFLAWVLTVRSAPTRTPSRSSAKRKASTSRGTCLRLEEVRAHRRFLICAWKPIHAPYLVAKASFVGCHQFGLLGAGRSPGTGTPGATLLLTSLSGRAGLGLR